jgi:hypothetical protein
METRMDEFKKYLMKGEKDFLEEYEPSINNFLEGLDNKGILNIVFTKEDSIRMEKLMTTSNSACTI